jgi:phosphoglycolate phosphatase-like HAD superfamily hydrolase
MTKPHKPRRTSHAGPPELWEERDALQAARIQWSDRPLVLVDLDGTLTNPEERLRYVKQAKKNWERFFEQVDRDPPVEAVLRWVRELAKEYDVVLVSGRPIDRAGQKTLWWLRHHRVPYEHLFMRRGGDRRPDTETKAEILRDLLHQVPKEQILFAIDDRPSVVEQVWRANGIRVFPVRASDNAFY